MVVLIVTVLPMTVVHAVTWTTDVTTAGSSSLGTDDAIVAGSEMVD